ncbi:hypothetical protein BDV93DRAFT_601695 [Ceratobasidium sp. AG-I]|nr:hypothetical protein BDV93DRAFT_601695 [Ceratobasidium sp. AG-I]
MLANPPSQSSPTNSGSTCSDYASLESYNTALHEYTRSLWMEARRQAESRAKDRATTVAPMNKNGRQV